MVIVLSFLSGAQSCRDLLAQPQVVSVEATQVRPLVFTNTDVFRRNNDIGLQQVGEIRLEKWIEIDFNPEHDYYNFIGLTQEGAIYQAIDWHGQRRIARQLSGEQFYKDLYVINDQIIAAVAQGGEVYLYSPYLWKKSPRSQLIKRGAALWAGISSLTTVGLYMFNPDIAPVLSVAASVAAAMQVGFVMLFRYDRENTFPDGFVKTDLVISSPEVAEGILSNLTPEQLRRFLLWDDLAVPERNSLFPQLPEEATEDIRR